MATCMRMIVKPKSNKEEKQMKDGFTAKEINFQGIPGYMVCQYHNGKKVVEQFVASKVYSQFCKALGIEPEIIK